MGTGITRHGCIGHHCQTRRRPVQPLILDKIAKTLPPICDEKGFDGGPLCDDNFVRCELDLEILNVPHALGYGAGDRGAVDKMLHLDKHIADEQGVHREKIEIRMRYIVGKGGSGYPNRVDAIGPARGKPWMKRWRPIHSIGLASYREVTTRSPMDRFSMRWAPQRVRMRVPSECNAAHVGRN